MGATAAVHPNDPVLRAYGLGKLDDVSSESVSKHLEGCDPCQRRVAALSSDDFLGRLRDAQGQPGPSGPFVSSLAGLSVLDNGPDAAPRPPTSSLPPGLADHPVYEVIRELGQGGMGTVSSFDGEQVTIKVPGKSDPVEIRAVPGSQVQVKSADTEMTGKSVSIGVGGEAPNHRATCPGRCAWAIGSRSGSLREAVQWQ